MKGMAFDLFALASSSTTLMRFCVYLDTMTFPHRALATSEGRFSYIISTATYRAFITPIPAISELGKDSGSMLSSLDGERIVVAISADMWS